MVSVSANRVFRGMSSSDLMSKVTCVGETLRFKSGLFLSFGKASYIIYSGLSACAELG